ncbi:MAG: hypothetical protein IT289_05260 [Oligoflexia bacterium]|nr:hypothetical protein [Oligoflexia bacterium]
MDHAKFIVMLNLLVLLVLLPGHLNAAEPVGTALACVKDVAGLSFEPIKLSAYQNAGQIPEIFGPSSMGFKGLAAKRKGWQADAEAPYPTPSPELWMLLSRTVKVPRDFKWTEGPKVYRQDVNELSFDAIKRRLESSERHESELIQKISSEVDKLPLGFPEMKNDHFVHRSIDPSLPLQEMPKFLSEIASVISSEGNHVVVKIELNGVPQTNVSPQAARLQRMFFIMSWQLVRLAYQNKGLTDSEVESAFALLNNWESPFQESPQPRDIFFLYDKRIWNSFLYRLHFEGQEVYSHFQNGRPVLRLRTLEDAFQPFFPLYGMTVVKRKMIFKDFIEYRMSSMVLGGPLGRRNWEQLPWEFSRLFHNLHQDPLRLFESNSLAPLVTQKGSLQRLNLAFYKAAVGSLPAGTEIEARSHSAGHTALYCRLFGFKKTREYTDQEWGNATVEVLNTTRERFLIRLESLIR